MEQQPQVAEEMGNLANEIRGIILGHATYLEKMLEYYIATFYCGETDRRDHLIEVLLTSGSGFRAKILAVLEILKHPENNAFLSKNGGIPENLDLIIRYRNSVAHDVVDTSMVAIEYYKTTGVIFLTRLYSAKRLPFTKEDIPKIHKLFFETITPMVTSLRGFHVRPYPKNPETES